MAVEEQILDEIEVRPPNEPSEPDFLSFRAMAAVVFQSNFTDNAFRLVAWLYLGAYAVHHQESQEIYRTLVAVFYTAPWVLLSLFAGQLADRLSKRNIVVGVKTAEVAILLVGMAGAAIWGSWLMPLILLSLLACRSAIFGPATYGLIPELMPEKRLSWANGWIDGLTFFGAILGTSLGGLAMDVFGQSLLAPLGVLLLLSILGVYLSAGIDKLPAAEPHRHVTLFPIKEARGNIKEIAASQGMTWATIGIVVWWGLAALALQAAMKMAEDTLHLNGFRTSWFFIYIGLGVGLGSYVAGRISGQKIELGLVPLGALLMAISAIAVHQVPGAEPLMAITITAVGFFSGWFIIPLKAYIQHNAHPDTRGGILGTINFFTYIMICISGGAAYYIEAEVFQFTAQQIFLSIGLFTLFVAIIAMIMLPGAGLRLILFLLTHSIYRVKVIGRDNIPDKGGALLVCNHMSYVDGLLVIVSLNRSVRPIMFEEIYFHPLVKPFAKLTRAIPISDRMGPREMIAQLQKASQAIQDGDLVCIFAEGQITRTGQLLPFRKGFERIMKNVEAPIVPMHLDRVRGSLLSFNSNRWLQKMPNRVPQPVTVSFGSQLPGNSDATTVRKAVLLLASDAWEHRKADAPMLHHEAFTTARRHPLAIAMYDHNTPKGITRAKFVGGIVAMARVLRREWEGQKMVGICLPPSIAGAVVNHAALLVGKVPVNLNYTASADVLANVGEQCELQTTITSRAFMEKLPLDLPGRVIYLEDIKPRLSLGLRLWSLFQALCVPLSYLERELGAPAHRSVDDLATVIFSSGSTGIPKGVMLSHWNIYSNIESVGQVFSLGHDDAILGVLPFFHSFGTMATLFLPHVIGIRVSYFPNPLDARAVGDLVFRHRVTFLLGTPTFLSTYTRRIDPREFGSLQIVLTGAEKLRDNVALAFERRFGIRPFEAYGCTECAPGVTVNTHDFRAPGFFQCGTKPGKIGHPLPGVTIRIVDPATNEDLPDGREGLMLVKGPNVMLGYLNRPDLTEEALRDGWYVTGDIAKIDEDGFVEITDRLARFSKIGGEMVPHLKVEEALNQSLGLSETCFAVCGVPDEKKGEKLAVLYTVSSDDARIAFDKVAKMGTIPNLWIPKFSDFHRLDALPYLGTGKMDLRQIKKLAMEFDQPDNQESAIESK